MNCRKSILAFFALVTLCFILSGCGKESPEKSMLTYAKAYLHEDSACLKQIGKSQEAVHASFTSYVNEIFAKDGYTKEQSSRIAAAACEVRKRIEIKTKLLEEKNGNRALVEITVTPLDFSKLEGPEFYKRTDEYLAQLPKPKSKKELNDQFLDFFLKEFQNMPLGESKSTTVYCTYDEKKKMWTPYNLTKFINALDDISFTR